MTKISATKCRLEPLVLRPISSLSLLLRLEPEFDQAAVRPDIPHNPADRALRESTRLWIGCGQPGRCASVPSGYSGTPSTTKVRNLAAFSRIGRRSLNAAE